MGIRHQFKGVWGQQFAWLGSRVRQYGSGASAGVTETWLIGRAEGARNFALRYYEIEAGGHSRLETHAHDHGLLFLQGSGQVLVGDTWHEVSQGDVVYIPPHATHQITNTSAQPLGFLCIIPAIREKSGGTVWAEEGLDGLRLVGGSDAPDGGA
jgi:quercetin dioxygenase-like cupin family protein